MADFWPPLLVAVLTILIIFLYCSTSNRNRNLPPSPRFPLPLIGHLHLLSQPAHRCLHRLSQSLGPIFSLRFGSRLVVVISSAAAAEDCFSQNDVVLASRPRLLAGDIVAYNFSTLLTAPYGPRWRSLRKTCTAQIFSPLRLSSLSRIWIDAIADLIRKILHRIPNSASKSTDRSVIVLRPLVKETIFEILMRICAGESGDLDAVMEAISNVLKHAETANPADFIPFLNWIDFRGLQRDLKRIFQEADRLLQRMLDERRRAIRNDNLIDNLLELQQSDPDFYDDEMIKGLVLVILSAGTDTTTVTIEWTMSALLNNPSILSKAKNEIDHQVGQDRKLNESDLHHLPYLQCIVSEAMRLHPPVPLLIPHCAAEDCEVAGYRIPRDTMVLVNAWAIHRDANVWDDPLRFRPERFEGRGFGAYEFMPFGFGRRACPGAGLASNVVGLALASLIQCFEWERCGDDEVDMGEGDGITMPKAKPLEAICKARPVTTSSVYA